MRTGDVDHNVILRIVREMHREFHTKDVSQHPAAKAAHSLHVHERSYNSVIGRHLSRNDAGIGIRQDESPRGRRGVYWIKA